MHSQTPRQEVRALNERKANVLVLLALLLPAVLTVAAYAINVVYMELVRTELQIATDVATRAAGRVFAVSGEKSEAIAAGIDFAAMNSVAGVPLALAESDFQFGVSTRLAEDQRYQFKRGPRPNAVKIRSKYFAASKKKGIPLIFPSMGIPITFRPIKEAISTQAELDIAIILDRSSSMAFANEESSSAIESSSTSRPSAASSTWGFGQPVPPNARWLDTVASVDAFLQIVEQSVQDERVALVTYSSATSTDVKLSSTYNEIRNAMQEHSVSFYGGYTNIGSGILEAVAALGDRKTARPWASRVIILMSDGNHNMGYDPIAAAQFVESQKTMIYTVSFSDEANQAQMAEIATIGLGQHYHATTAEQLSEAFREIANSLPNLITY